MKSMFKKERDKDSFCSISYSDAGGTVVSSGFSFTIVTLATMVFQCKASLGFTRSLVAGLLSLVEE
jgi:hypothetical protein